MELYLALPSIHCLLIELLSNVEIDLCGAHAGGGFDVELLAVLADLHVGIGGRCHSHLPQHGVHPWSPTTGTDRQLVKGTIIVRGSTSVQLQYSQGFQAPVSVNSCIIRQTK